MVTLQLFLFSFRPFHCRSNLFRRKKEYNKKGIKIKGKNARVNPNNDFPSSLFLAMERFFFIPRSFYLFLFGPFSGSLDASSWMVYTDSYALIDNVLCRACRTLFSLSPRRFLLLRTRPRPRPHPRPHPRRRRSVTFIHSFIHSFFRPLSLDIYVWNFPTKIYDSICVLGIVALLVKEKGNECDFDLEMRFKRDKIKKEIYRDSQACPA